MSHHVSHVFITYPTRINRDWGHVVCFGSMRTYAEFENHIVGKMEHIGNQKTIFVMMSMRMITRICK